MHVREMRVIKREEKHRVCGGRLRRRGVWVERLVGYMDGQMVLRARGVFLVRGGDSVGRWALSGR